MSARLAAAAAALLTLWTAGAAAAAADGVRLPRCGQQAACYCESMPAGSFKLYCREILTYTFRVTYSAASTESGASVVVWCNPMTMQRSDYDVLADYNMTMGAVESVVFNLCPLPPGRIAGFFERLGIVGVRLLKVLSHDVLNDTIPADFLRGTNLTNVQFNDLRSIAVHDDFFATTRHLQSLTISGSTLELPDALFRHTPRLAQLGLTGNRLQRLPESLLDGLTDLTLLSLGNNRLSALTRRHFRDLGRLEMLDLYRNEISTLPDDVFAPLASLQTLRMQNNPLQALPERLFAGTPGLRLLRLNGGRSRGNVTQLPAGLFRGLGRLELLMLDLLNMRRLPAGLFDGLTALANLTLDHNRLETLPDDVFAGLASLRNVDLRANRLTTLPAGLLGGLAQLDTLFLSDNRLAALPDDMFVSTPRLGRLFVSRNNLSSVRQRTFSGLADSLRLLRLDGNQLTLSGRAVVAPPFQELVQLQEFSLAHNRIRFITQDLLNNLHRLRRLDLRFNRLQRLTFEDLNFLCEDADIDLRQNNISVISFPLATMKVDGNSPRRPNRIDVRDNPLRCDCKMFPLHAYLNGSGRFKQRDKLDELFELKTDGLACAQPPALAGQPFAGLRADQLLCVLTTHCPAGCECQEQSSPPRVLVTCNRLPAGAPLPTRLPRVGGHAVSLHLERAGLRQLTNLSATSAPVRWLHLSHNRLQRVEPALLPPTLRLLRLDHNNISTVSPALVDYLKRTGARVALGANPLVCDCDLLPFYHLMQLRTSSGSRQFADVANVSCVGRDEILLEMSEEDVCPSATVVIAVCVVAAAMTMCLLVSAVLYYNYSDTIRAWLYAHNMCLGLVTEEELDADKKYDAFVSYSHLDEQFVVEQLVPQLEHGEPKYSLCLHFRDWLAGEWITDQIQRSVQDSRRVIVVMSQNFIQSEWGRLEFLAAHKQALNDKRNRVILVVYGELPDPAAMDPELRLYISMNTYLKWGDALFWERLRYALPHKGRRLKRRRRRRLTSDKLGLIIRENGLSSAGSTPAATPTVELPATPGTPAAHGHVNGCFVGDKLAPIVESRHGEQCGENAV